jgi:hypothetical protein
MFYRQPAEKAEPCLNLVLSVVERGAGDHNAAGLSQTLQPRG